MKTTSFIQRLRSYFIKHPKQIPAAPKPPAHPALMRYLRQLPKAELHVHFEGSLNAEIIWQLAQKYAVSEIQNRNQAEWSLVFRDPHEFFQRFLFLSSLLREPEDFYFAAKTMGRRFADENIQYAEVTLAPHKFIRTGINFSEMMRAIDHGLSEGSGHRCVFRFIIDVVRDLGPDCGMEMLRLVERQPHDKIAAVGLGGGEQHPPERFAEVFQYAAAIGLQKTAHAGEGRGPLSVWGALRSLKVKRIDHGVRSREDPKLVEYLCEQGIALNLCPASNVMLGVVHSIDDHPIRQYFERGVPVNVSTDDPGFFHTTLTDELARCVAYHGFSLQEIPALIANAVKASFLSEPEKKQYLSSFSQQAQDLAPPPAPIEEP